MEVPKVNCLSLTEGLDDNGGVELLEHGAELSETLDGAPVLRELGDVLCELLDGEDKGLDLTVADWVVGLEVLNNKDQLFISLSGLVH